MALPASTADREKAKFDRNNNVKVALGNELGAIDIQNPLPCDGDSIYAKDIDEDNSDLFGFDGEITDFFTSLTSVSTDRASANPKRLKFWFNRTIYSSAVGLGCNDPVGTFSNVKLILLGSGEAVRREIDLSADNTKYTSLLIQFEPSAFNGFILEFYTADTVCLSNITARKDVKVDAQLEAQKSDGTMVHIKASNSGNLQIQDAESGLAIAKGDVQDTTFIHKFGDAPNFGIADGFVTVWDGANGALNTPVDYVYSATADIGEVSSSSAADTGLLEVQGLDSNYSIITQTVALTGQAKVSLPTPLIRVFRAKNVGSTDLVGQVYVYVTGSAITGGVPAVANNVRAIVNNGNNQTLMAVFTIPAGYTGYMRDWYAAASAAKRDSVHQIELVARPFGQVFQMKHKSSISITGTSYIQHVYNEPEVFTEKTDIEIHANTDQADAGVSAGFDIVLVKNEV